MSNVPPPVPPEQPPNYAAYYRGDANVDPNKLRLLKEGYFGLNTVFLVNILMAVGANVAFRSSEDLGLFAIAVIVVFVAIGLLTYPQNKKIGEGLGWAPSSAVLASVLMGLNSALCCGIIGYMVVQSMALKGMKAYGVTAGIFGLKKSVVEQRIAELEAAKQTIPTPS